MAALAATWLLIQSVFALRCARRYYQGGGQGLSFPGGGQPDYLDFAYFAAVIGMTAQVADVAIATTPCAGSRWRTGWCPSPSTCWSPSRSTSWPTPWVEPHQTVICT